MASRFSGICMTHPLPTALPTCDFWAYQPVKIILEPCFVYNNEFLG